MNFQLESIELMPEPRPLPFELKEAEKKLLEIAKLAGWKMGGYRRQGRGWQISMWRGECGSVIECRVGRKQLRVWLGTVVKKIK